jgi:hypothetical protein
MQMDHGSFKKIFQPSIVALRVDEVHILSNVINCKVFTGWGDERGLIHSDILRCGGKGNFTVSDVWKQDCIKLKGRKWNETHLRYQVTKLFGRTRSGY